MTATHGVIGKTAMIGTIGMSGMSIVGIDPDPTGITSKETAGMAEANA